MDIKEVEEGMDWVDLAQDRVKGQDIVNKVINFGVP